MLQRTVFLPPRMAIFLKVVLLLSMAWAVIKLSTSMVSNLMDDCGASAFMDHLCAHVERGHITGPSCADLCATDEKHSVYSCPRTVNHHLSDHVLLQSSGAAYSLSRAAFEHLAKTDRNAVIDDVTAARDNLTSLTAALIKTLDMFLNPGNHEAILHSIAPPPAVRPLPQSYTSSVAQLLSNKRYILNALFHGSGESSEESPGSSSATVPGVSLHEFCGPVYRADGLDNYTLPLTMFLNSSNWVFKPRLSEYYVYQVILQLLGMEEALSEHSLEGKFFLCNINSSQILLHSRCSAANPSNFYLLDKECTLKLLDISTALFSEAELNRTLSSNHCDKSSQCHFYSCDGRCVSGRCAVSLAAQFAGIRQICQIINSFSRSQLTGKQSEQETGQLFSLIDRCLQLSPDVHSPLTHNVDLEYNIVFQNLRKLFINKLVATETALRRHVKT